MKTFPLKHHIARFSYTVGATCHRTVDWIVLLFPHHATHWGYDVIDLIAPATSLSTYEKYIYFNLPSKYVSIDYRSDETTSNFTSTVSLSLYVMPVSLSSSLFTTQYFCFYGRFDLLSIRLSTRPEFSVRDALHHISHRLYVPTGRLYMCLCKSV